MRVNLSNIRHDKDGFEALVYLYAQTKECAFEVVEINMETAKWFDADMCSAFGAVLYYISENINTVKLTNLHSGVEKILSKNGFLSHYGRASVPDNWGTTMPYKRFDVKDDRLFAQYIETELMHRSEMPMMSSELSKKFRNNIFEIFSNAVLHSRTKDSIFSCGQFFPKKHMLNFSVADLGVGIRQNVEEYTHVNWSPEEAIAWAFTTGHTTKRGEIPGGLGLKLLQEFIDLNDGRIQIVSDAGYWQRQHKETTIGRLSEIFPGTVVNIEINTADNQSYALSSELSGNDIF